MNRIIIFSVTALAVSCSAAKINTGMIHEQAPVIIYKTTADYFFNVPVSMNEARDRIVSFPAPSDLYYNGEPALPGKLKKGYLLDRRGINANSVFTSYTYSEYAALEAPPSLEELHESIIDKHPFKAMYNCGKKSDYQDLISELNEAISNNLTGFKTMIR